MKSKTVACYEELAKTVWNKRNDVFFIFIYVFCIGFLCHGYLFLNHIVSHDSLNSIYRDGVGIVAIGRFCQFFYIKLVGGHVVTPLVTGVLSLVYISFGAFLIVDMFEIRKKLSVAFVCGILVANYCYTLTAATYLSDLDTYMLSLLLAILAVYVMTRNENSFFIPSIFIVLSLGFYGAYFQVAVLLLMMILLKKLFVLNDAKKVLALALKYFLMLVLGLVLYYILWKGILFCFKIVPSNAYNGLTGVGHYNSLKDILSLVLHTYTYIAKKILHPPLMWHWQVVSFFTVIMIFFAIYAIVSLIVARHLKKSTIVLLFVLLLGTPFGVNCVYFISKGMMHDLMIYSLSILPFFAVFLCELCDELNVSLLKGMFKHVVSFCLLVIIYTNVVNANQIYLKKDLESKATLSVMTRIIDRLEQLDGYEVGKTPVVFIGDFYGLGAALGINKPGFDYTLTGLQGRYSITYREVEWAYMFRVLGYPINYIFNSDAFDNQEIVKKMSPFPAKDCCRLVDGVAVVKVSECQ